MDTTYIPALIRESAPADGFVVVSVWTPGRYNSTRHTYDFFNTLPEALAHHNMIVAGRVRDHEPNGIFAALNGMPVRSALNLETMRYVEPAPWKRLPDCAKSTPENKMLKESSLRMRSAPTDCNQCSRRPLRNRGGG